MLVAISLMALLSVILFGGLRFGMRAWEVGGEYIDRLTRIERIQNLLRQEIGQALLPAPGAIGVPVPTFFGGPESLTFVAALPAHRGIAGPHLFQLAWRKSDGRSDLVLTWTLFRPERVARDIVPEEGAQSVLIENVAVAELSYYGALDEQRPPEWQSVWDGVNLRPRLVRLHVEFPLGDPRRWPDLIIRVVGSES